MSKTLIFLAAGFGSRFGNGVKQLEPVGPDGEVLMDYAVHDAIQAGFDRVIFIIRKDLEELVRGGVGRRTEAKCEVVYVFQELNDIPTGYRVTEGRIKPWGTAQALWACRKVIDGPFCVLNADDYYGPRAFQLIHDAIFTCEQATGGLELCMAGYVLGNTLSKSGAVTRGLCLVSEQGLLEGIRETHGIYVSDGTPCVQDADGTVYQIDPDAVVSMNIWGMPAAFVDYAGEGFERFLRALPSGDISSEYLIPTLVGDMLRSGHGSVRVLPTNDRWFGMTYAQDKAVTRQRIAGLIREGYYPDKL